MGYAIEAKLGTVRRRVVIVSRPTKLDAPLGRTGPGQERAADVDVSGVAGNGDIVVMSAAVADYMPARGVASGQIEKGEARWSAAIVPDARNSPRYGRQRAGAPLWPVLVGFAAESGDPARGTREVHTKAVDLIVANDITRGPMPDRFRHQAATIIGSDGEEVFRLGLQTDLASHASPFSDSASGSSRRSANAKPLWYCRRGQRADRQNTADSVKSLAASDEPDRR